MRLNQDTDLPSLIFVFMDISVWFLHLASPHGCSMCSFHAASPCGSSTWFLPIASLWRAFPCSLSTRPLHGPSTYLLHVSLFTWPLHQGSQTSYMVTPALKVKEEVEMPFLLMAHLETITVLLLSHSIRY